MQKYSITLVFLFLFLSLRAEEQKHFVIITASYNNAASYKQNLNSIFSQNYDNWRLVYIDDCSTDDTEFRVQNYIKQCTQEDRVTFIQNSKRCGHLYNQYHAIHSCKNTEIVVILDGDDWFAHSHVLAHLNQIYQDHNIWLTYGQFKELTQDAVGYCRSVALSVIEKNNFREHPWVFGHLRTFYVGLFKLIKKEDLFYNGSFFPMAADVATMIPMLEMAGERIHFIEEILYIHNDTNPLNLNKAWPMQSFLKKIIYNRAKYSRISSFLSSSFFNNQS